LILTVFALGKVNMADEQTSVRRCGWILLVFVFLLLHGILPGSFLGGVAGLKAADTLLGQLTGFDLIRRLFVLAGMIVSFLVLAMLSMVVTMVAGRIVGSLRKLPAVSAKRGEKCGLER
jgi:hypothetical protein